MGLLQVRVRAKRPEAEDICSFELVSADNKVPLPAFDAGAHIDVHVPGGLVRQYSLCNAPTEQGFYRIGVLKDASGRGGSRAMHEAVDEGDLLTISAPRNQFPLINGEAPSLLLAGGIGITPILAMAQVLAEKGTAFELHYCTRSKSKAAFLDLLQAGKLGEQLRLHLDDGPGEQRLNIEAALAGQDKKTHLYVCGPRGFMDAVLGSARNAGWKEERLHYEFFRAGPVTLEGDQPFDVRLAISGRVIHVPADRSVIQALADAGVAVPTSCEQGICGTCVTRVLEGIPDHRDSYLMPEEQAVNDCMTPCCSRAHSSVLVLDL